MFETSSMISQLDQYVYVDDMPRLRELILTIDDTSFSPQKRTQLDSWLLKFAIQFRDSKDTGDVAVVWSAIRTGASMIGLDAADHLLTLMELGHHIETSLVAVKMLGRIFEVRPPTDVDQHSNLADGVLELVTPLLKPCVIKLNDCPPMVSLAIYALAAMACSEVIPVVETVHKLGIPWITRWTTHKLRDLREVWQIRPDPVSDKPRELLENALRTLQRP